MLNHGCVSDLIQAMCEHHRARPQDVSHRLSPSSLSHSCCMTTPLISTTNLLADVPSTAFCLYASSSKLITSPAAYSMASGPSGLRFQKMESSLIRRVTAAPKRRFSNRRRCFTPSGIEMRLERHVTCQLSAITAMLEELQRSWQADTVCTLAHAAELLPQHLMQFSGLGRIANAFTAILHSATLPGSCMHIHLACTCSQVAHEGSAAHSDPAGPCLAMSPPSPSAAAAVAAQCAPPAGKCIWCLMCREALDPMMSSCVHASPEQIPERYTRGRRCSRSET